MRTEDIAILGGGLAGLTAGYFSGAPIFEADCTPGGVGRSDQVDGFTFDRGIHVLQTRHQSVLDLLDELGVRFRETERHAYIYARGSYSSYPFQVNSSGLPLALRVRCVRDFLMRSRVPAPRNYEDWIRGSVGNGFADTFLIPYSEKFWGVHPRELTFEWAGARVPQPNVWQVLRGAVLDKRTSIGTNSTFKYPTSGGYGAIAAELSARVERLSCGYRATSIDLGRREMKFANGNAVRYRRLISTIPLPEFVRIASKVPEEVGKAAESLRTNSILVVNLGLAGDLQPVRHWVHFPESDIAFFRVSLPGHFEGDTVPQGHASISAEISYKGTPPDATEAVDRTIADLQRVGLLSPTSKIVSTSTTDIRYGYVIYDFARQPALDIIHSWMRSNNIVPCGRYGMWSYFWSDEAMLSGRDAAQLVGESDTDLLAAAD